MTDKITGPENRKPNHVHAFMHFPNFQSSIYYFIFQVLHFAGHTLVLHFQSPHFG